MSGSIVIITGSRTWIGRRDIEIDLMARLRPTVFVGDCLAGADALAQDIANELGCDVRRFCADWPKHGRKAGPLRNGEMVAAAVAEATERRCPLNCLAYWDGASPGTRDCIAQAVRAGIRVSISAQKTAVMF